MNDIIRTLVIESGMPDAYGAREFVKKIREEALEKYLKEITNKIIEACEKGEDCICYWGRYNDLIIEILRELGYEVKKESNQQDGSYLEISWREPGEEATWIERKRWDGSSFYECSSCGNVAAAEKSCHCPNCKKKMNKGD